MAEGADDTTFEEQESPPPQPAGTALEKLANSVNSVFIGGGEDQNDASHPEYEGESSLFAQAVYATEFLQCSLSCDPSSRAASEMNSVLNALRNAVDAQKQRTDTLQNLYPNARQLPPGANLRDLPLPDTNKVLACLRMAEGK
ncbi:hypothetical protein NEMBOFW57_008593 [Staphylotrichum longicolle]|uniref:Uncharacterized protein n=1 Tax=Staphylotrichum longicolle TaxID=669026 RepID=A0AAD4ES00_9PEZI|nr:hypothetical protein NEMBOFW57_008593 [Staphylotrichum longicolle]